MTIEASGFGAGTREIDGRPNLTQVVLGRGPTRRRRAPAAGGAAGGQRRRRHRRDAGPPIAALLDAGAHDAWVTPIVMKKGRPAHTSAPSPTPRTCRPSPRP